MRASRVGLPEVLGVFRERLEAQEKEWANLVEQLWSGAEREEPAASGGKLWDLYEVGARISHAFQRLEELRRARDGPAPAIRAAAREARVLTEAIDRALGRLR